MMFVGAKFMFPALAVCVYYTLTFFFLGGGREYGHPCFSLSCTRLIILIKSDFASTNCVLRKEGT
jgi:hypothetical protein